MKNIYIGLLIALFTLTGRHLANAQASVCSGFHKKYCHMEKGDPDAKQFMYNAQSKSGLFAQGTSSKMRVVVYRGNDYRITVCCETTDNVNFKIFDARTNELLFDNAQNENTQEFQFQAASTRSLIIEASIPAGEIKEEKGKASDAACVGLLIENKVSDRVGFSQY